MRCFFGVPLPEEIRSSVSMLARKVNSSGADVKTVEDENLHITLYFLGDAEPEQIAGKMRTFTFAPFDVKLSGIGAFPDKKTPRVVWLGVSAGSEQLIDLNRRIVSTLRLAPDRFHPHITLARVRSMRNAEKLQPLFSEKAEFEAFEVSSFTLFSSALTPSGPIYQKVASIPF